MATSAANNEKSPDSTSKLDSMPKKDLIILFKKQVLINQRTKSKCSEFSVENELLKSRVVEFEKKQRQQNDESECMHMREESLRLATQALTLETQQYKQLIQEMEVEMEKLRRKNENQMADIVGLRDEIKKLESLLRGAEKDDEEDQKFGKKENEEKLVKENVERKVEKESDKMTEKMNEWEEMMRMMQTERTEMTDLLTRQEEGLGRVVEKVNVVINVLEAVFPERDVVLEMARSFEGEVKSVKWDGDGGDGVNVLDGLLERIKHLRCIVDEMVWERDEIKEKITHLYENSEDKETATGGDNEVITSDTNMETIKNKEENSEVGSIIDIFNKFEVKHRAILTLLKDKEVSFNKLKEENEESLQRHQLEIQNKLDMIRALNARLEYKNDISIITNHIKNQTKVVSVSTSELENVGVEAFTKSIDKVQEEKVKEFKRIDVVFEGNVETISSVSMNLLDHGVDGNSQLTSEVGDYLTEVKEGYGENGDGKRNEVIKDVTGVSHSPSETSQTMETQTENYWLVDHQATLLQLQEELHDVMLQFEKEKHDWVVEKESVEGMLKKQEGVIEALEKENVLLKDQLEEREVRMKELRNDLDERMSLEIIKRQENEEISDEMNCHKKELKVMTELNEGLEKKVNEMKEEIAKLNVEAQQIQDLKQQLEQQSHEYLTQERMRLQQEHQEVDMKRKLLEEQHSRLEELQKQLKEEKEQMLLDKERIRQQQSSLKHEEQVEDQKVKEFQDQVQQLQEQNEYLEKQLNLDQEKCSQLQKLHEEKKELKEKQFELQTQLEQQQTQLKQQQTQLKQQQTHQEHKLNEEQQLKQQLKKQQAYLEQQQKDLEQQQKDLEQQQKDLNRQQKNLDEQQKQQKEEKQQIAQEHEQLHLNQQQLQQQQNNLKEEKQVEKQKVQEQQQQNEQLEKELKLDQLNLHSEKKALEEKQTWLQTKLEQQQALEQNIKEQQQDLEKQRQELDEQKCELQTQLEQQRTQLEQQEQKLEQQKQELEEQQRGLKEQQQSLEKLKEQLEREKEQNNEHQESLCQTKDEHDSTKNQEINLLTEQVGSLKKQLQEKLEREAKLKQLVLRNKKEAAEAKAKFEKCNEESQVVRLSLETAHQLQREKEGGVELREEEMHALKIQLRTHMQEKTEFEKKMTVLGEELEDVKKKKTMELAEVEARLSHVNQQLVDAKKDIQQSQMMSLEMSDYERTVCQLNEQLAVLQEQLQETQENQRHLTEQKKGSDKFIEGQEKEVKQLGKVNEQLKKDNLSFKQQLNEAFHKAEEDKRRMIEIQSGQEVFMQQLEEKKILIYNLSTDKASLETKLRTNDKDNRNSRYVMQETVNRLQRELSMTNENLEKVQVEFDAYKVRVHSVLKQQKERKNEDFESMKMKKEKEQLHKENTKLKTQLSKFNTEFLSLEEENDGVKKSLTLKVTQLSKLSCRIVEVEAEWKERMKMASEKEAGEHKEAQAHISTLKHNHARIIECMEEDLNRVTKELEDTKEQVVSLKQQLHTTTPTTTVSTQDNNVKSAVSGIREDAEGSENTDNKTTTISSTSSPLYSELASECIGPLKSTTTPLESPNLFQSPTISTTPSVRHPLQAVLYPSSTDLSPRKSFQTSDDEYLHQEEIARLKIALASSLKQAVHLRELLNETEASVVGYTEQAKLLKAEIRRLERNQERGSSVSNMEYLKNVIIKFVELEVVEERIQLVPVLSTMLKLSCDEKDLLTSIANGNHSTAAVTQASHASWTSYLNSWSGGMI